MAPSLRRLRRSLAARAFFKACVCVRPPHQAPASAKAPPCKSRSLNFPRKNARQGEKGTHALTVERLKKTSLATVWLKIAGLPDLPEFLRLEAITSDQALGSSRWQEASFREELAPPGLPPPSLPLSLASLPASPPVQEQRTCFLLQTTTDDDDDDDPQSAKLPSSSKAQEAGVSPSPWALGFLVLRAFPGGDATVLKLAVDPAFQGQGYGTALLQAAISQAQAYHCVRVFLEVREENAVALGLYEKCCFKKIAKRKFFYSDGASAWTMELRFEASGR